jgi:hypothetical protein
MIAQVGTHTGELPEGGRADHFNITVDCAVSDGTEDMHMSVLSSVPFDSDEKGFDRIIRERIVIEAKTQLKRDIDPADIKMLFVVVF